MDVVLYVCLWLGHFLHQHVGSGPAGSTWLGGIVTYTTDGDWCTETVYCPSATIVGYFQLVLRVSEYAFL